MNEQAIPSGEMEQVPAVEQVESRLDTAESSMEQVKATPEEELGVVDHALAERTEEFARVKGVIADTKEDLAEAREKLGLSPTDEKVPSVAADERRLDELHEQQAELEEQRKEIVEEAEKQRMIEEEKQKILEEMVGQLFEELKNLDPTELASLARSGTTSSGGQMESRAMSSLSPEMAKQFAEQVQSGAVDIASVVRAMPELLKQFDEFLTEEATRRVEQRLEEAKEDMEDKREVRQGQAETEDEQNPDEGTEAADAPVPGMVATDGDASTSASSVSTTNE